MKRLLLLALIFTAVAAAQADEFDSDGVKIHYTVQGVGEPVVLIHGLCTSAKINWDMPGITAELAKHYQVIEFDNRGHGLSDRPEAKGQYGLKMVGDVLRLMDHLHVEKARMVGYSMGGMMVMKLMTTHPERVTSGVLGGMGWYKPNTKLPFMVRFLGHSAPSACLDEFVEFGVTEDEVKAVHVPVTVIVGEKDHCRKLYVEPLHEIRPDWPIHLIKGASHLNCIMKPDFKDQVVAAVASNGLLAKP
jgi:pimeloyl-ACP methyl ester carboxylesterase